MNVNILTISSRLWNNRIIKLTRDEAKAQRKITQTQKFANFFLQTRHKFHIDQSIKNEHKYQQYVDLRNRREKFTQDRINSNERKKEIRKSVIEHNIRESLNIKHALKEGFRDRDMRFKNEIEQKMQKIKQIREYHQRHSLMKQERQMSKVYDNKNRFDMVLNKDHSRASSNLKQMKKLQKQEKAIMEKLKETLSMQESMKYF